MFFRVLLARTRRSQSELSRMVKAKARVIYEDGSLHEKACDRLFAKATLAKQGGALLPLIACRGGLCQETGVRQLSLNYPQYK